MVNLGWSLLRQDKLHIKLLYAVRVQHKAFISICCSKLELGCGVQLFGTWMHLSAYRINPEAIAQHPFLTASVRKSLGEAVHLLPLAHQTFFEDVAAISRAHCQ